MFYRKWSEVDFNSKQITSNVLRVGAVEEEANDMQEVRASNPCKYGKLVSGELC